MFEDLWLTCRYYAIAHPHAPLPNIETKFLDHPLMTHELRLSKFPPDTK